MSVRKSQKNKEPLSFLRSQQNSNEDLDENRTFSRARTLVKNVVDSLSLWLKKRQRSVQAVRELIANPEDTKKVFEVIAAMRGKSLLRIFKRFKATTTGEKVLRQKLELLDLLNDHAYLKSLKSNSFASAYLNFLEASKIDSSGLVYASGDDYYESVTDPEILLFMRRNRDSHDLWHTLTHYGRNTLGESCLLAFTYAQTKNPGIRLILILSSIRLYRQYGHGTFAALWRAYGDGKKASWLIAQPYEDLLPLDIDQLRVMLSIPDPTVYQVVLARQNTPKKRMIG